MSRTTIDLTGKKAVIIGGTSGMGLSIARHILDVVGGVVVTGRSESSAAKAVA